MSCLLLTLRLCIDNTTLFTLLLCIDNTTRYSKDPKAVIFVHVSTEHNQEHLTSNTNIP